MDGRFHTSARDLVETDHKGADQCGNRHDHQIFRQLLPECFFLLFFIFHFYYLLSFLISLKNRGKVFCTEGFNLPLVKDMQAAAVEALDIEIHGILKGHG